jgi:S-adenosylmethionine:tRNA-ribosyltransferase-isomerase (queuine synthetase)
MSNSSIDDYVSEFHAVHPSIGWPTAGTEITGDIFDAWRRQATEYGTDEPRWWDDDQTKPVMETVINWTVDGEKRTSYLKPAAERVLIEKVRETGGRLSAGGKATVRRIEDGEAKTKGYNAPHRFECTEFVPNATATAGVDNTLDGI